MAKWRYFAERELPRVIRELGLPAARALRDHPLTVCPLHKEPLGAVTRMCEPCHRAAWDEIGRRYAAQGRPILTTQPEPKDDSTMTTTIEDEPLEGELVTTTPGTELVPHAGTLFGTSDPRVALERMADIATALVDVIDTKKLYATIDGQQAHHRRRLDDIGRHARRRPDRHRHPAERHAATGSSRRSRRAPWTAVSSAPPKANARAPSRSGRAATRTRSAAWPRPGRSAVLCGHRSDRSSCSPATRRPPPKRSPGRHRRDSRADRPRTAPSASPSKQRADRARPRAALRARRERPEHRLARPRERDRRRPGLGSGHGDDGGRGHPSARGDRGGEGG